MPRELLILRYREHFKLDYWQVYFTPYRVMLRDMQVLSLENSIKNKYRSAKEKAKQRASGRKK